jgi:hypothetical protein
LGEGGAVRGDALVACNTISGRDGLCDRTIRTLRHRWYRRTRLTLLLLLLRRARKPLTESLSKTGKERAKSVHIPSARCLWLWLRLGLRTSRRWGRTCPSTVAYRRYGITDPALHRQAGRTGITCRGIRSSVIAVSRPARRCRGRWRSDRSARSSTVTFHTARIAPAAVRHSGRNGRCLIRSDRRSAGRTRRRTAKSGARSRSHGTAEPAPRREWFRARTRSRCIADLRTAFPCFHT